MVLGQLHNYNKMEQTFIVSLKRVVCLFKIVEMLILTDADIDVVSHDLFRATKSLLSISLLMHRHTFSNSFF